ncbi:T9SS type A sorting domain-containing protein [Dyadobacter sp. 676]|uniref:T9SS type A sorting domain-containing protein n=1 Tax=Dyadobacter sp. 676 TaxID=3088362 RepID=A0AAU8FQN7_9BACT
MKNIKLLISAIAASGIGIANAQELRPQLDFIRNGSLLTVRSASGQELGTVDLDKPAVKSKVIAFTYSAKKKRGIENALNAVTIFPNPASGSLNLRLKGSWKYPVDVQIFDKTGNMLQTSRLESPEEPLDIESLKQGIYILKARSGNAGATEELVVQ